MGNLKLTSSAFSDGGEIPRECGYKNGNKQPPLTVSGTPDGTKSLALIMDDPDAMGAVGKVWVHWLYFTTGELNQLEGIYHENTIHGKTDFGEIGYGGPAPPNGRHTYIFKGYAIDTKLDLKEGYSKQELEDAMKGHIIEEARLTGTFTP